MGELSRNRSHNSLVVQVPCGCQSGNSDGSHIHGGDPHERHSTGPACFASVKNFETLHVRLDRTSKSTVTQFLPGFLVKRMSRYC